MRQLSNAWLSNWKWGHQLPRGRALQAVAAHSRVRGFYLIAGLRGGTPPSDQLAAGINTLRGREGNETDSQAGGTPRVPGEAAGGEGVLWPARRPPTLALRPQWEIFLHPLLWSPPQEALTLPRRPGTSGRVGGGAVL